MQKSQIFVRNSKIYAHKNACQLMIHMCVNVTMALQWPRIRGHALLLQTIRLQPLQKLLQLQQTSKLLN